MLPDLRFVIGAVLVTVVLGVTSLGLYSAIRLAQEARTGPLDTSRPLAYTAPAPSEQAKQPGGPFANVPADRPVTAQAVAPEPDAASAAAEQTADAADDHAAVDERAVVDPPLSPDGEPLPDEARSIPTETVAPESVTPEPATAAAPPADIAEPSAEPTGSIPAAPERIEGSAKPKPAAKAKRAVKKAAKPAQRARSGNVIAPTASTGYPVMIERAPNAGARKKSGGFPFGD